ncbi:hypothetical protein D3C72_2124310 [compost metagenome]
MKPGVSLQVTTLLPSSRSAKSRIVTVASGLVAFPDTSSSRRMMRGGLKKWVMRKSAAKLSGRPSTSECSGIVEVLEETTEPFLRTPSMAR